MPILLWGDIPALGVGSKAGERYVLSEGKCVSAPLLPVWADFQALSGKDEQSGPDGTVADVCGDLLEAWVEQSRGEHNPEWLEDCTMFDDDVVGCTGAGGETQAVKPVEAGASAGVGWSLCVGMGRKAPGAGGSRPWGRPAGSSGLCQRT